MKIEQHSTIQFKLTLTVDQLILLRHVLDQGELEMHRHYEAMREIRYEGFGDLGILARKATALTKSLEKAISDEGL